MRIAHLLKQHVGWVVGLDWIGLDFVVMSLEWMGSYQPVQVLVFVCSTAGTV